MKTKIAILFIICTSAAFLLGAKTAKKLKYPYLPARFSEPTAVSKLELTCMRNEFRSAEIAEKPIVINRTIQDKRKRTKQVPVIFIDHIVFSPTKKCIKIDAYIRTKTKLTQQDLRQVCDKVDKYFRQQFNDPLTSKKHTARIHTITVRRGRKIVAQRKLDATTKTILD